MGNRRAATAGSSLAPLPHTRCPAHQTLKDVNVQDPQPDGDHNLEPVKVNLRGACGAEAISQKPWIKVYSAETRVVVKAT